MTNLNIERPQIAFWGFPHFDMMHDLNLAKFNITENNFYHKLMIEFVVLDGDYYPRSLDHLQDIMNCSNYYSDLFLITHEYYPAIDFF